MAQVLTVGDIRAAVERVAPEMLQKFFKTPQGRAALENAVAEAITGRPSVQQGLVKQIVDSPEFQAQAGACLSTELVTRESVGHVFVNQLTNNPRLKTVFLGGVATALTSPDLEQTLKNSHLTALIANLVHPLAEHSIAEDTTVRRAVSAQVRVEVENLLNKGMVQKMVCDAVRSTLQPPPSAVMSLTEASLGDSGGSKRARSPVGNAMDLADNTTVLFSDAATPARTNTTPSTHEDPPKKERPRSDAKTAGKSATALMHKFETKLEDHGIDINIRKGDHLFDEHRFLEFLNEVVDFEFTHGRGKPEAKFPGMAMFLGRVNRRFKMNWTMSDVWMVVSEKSRGPIAQYLPHNFDF